MTLVSFKRTNFSFAEIMCENTLIGKLIAKLIDNNNISVLASEYSEDVKPSAKTNFKLKERKTPQANATTPIIVKIIMKLRHQVVELLLDSGEYQRKNLNV